MNLAGKDYFTVPEAAEYACISLSQWRAKVQREFPPGVFYGKLVYRRVDVQRFMESKTRWPRPSPESVATSRRADLGGESPLARRLLGRSKFVG